MIRRLTAVQSGMRQTPGTTYAMCAATPPQATPVSNHHGRTALLTVEPERGSTKPSTRCVPTTPIIDCWACLQRLSANPSHSMISTPARGVWPAGGREEACVPETTGAALKLDVVLATCCECPKPAQEASHVNVPP